MPLPMRELLNLKLSSASLPVDRDIDVGDASIKEDFDLAFELLQDEGLATDAVISTLCQFSTTKAKVRDNRRVRSSSEHPARYKPVPHDAIIRRELLFHWIREMQKIKEEQQGWHGDDIYFFRCMVMEIVRVVLNHAPFYANVAITQVCVSYTGTETLDMHALAYAADQLATPAGSKDESAVTRVKAYFYEVLRRRFGDRISFRKDGASYRHIARKPSEKDLNLLRHYLVRFLPSTTTTTADLSVLGKKGEPHESSEEGIDDMSFINQFMNLTNFDELALEAGAERIENRLSIPLIVSKASPDSDPNNGGEPTRQMPVCDLDGIKQAVKREQKRKRRVRPQGALAIHVDGVVQNYLGHFQKSCALDLEEHSSIVNMVALDEDDREVILATYLLFHDDEAKEEVWNVAIPGMGRVQCVFVFRENGLVVANFILVEKVSQARCTAGLSEPEAITKVTNAPHNRGHHYKHDPTDNHSWRISALCALERLLTRDSCVFPPGYVSAAEPMSSKGKVLIFKGNEACEGNTKEVVLIKADQLNIAAALCILGPPLQGRSDSVFPDKADGTFQAVREQSCDLLPNPPQVIEHMPFLRKRPFISASLFQKIAALQITPITVKVVESSSDGGMRVTHRVTFKNPFQAVDGASSKSNSEVETVRVIDFQLHENTSFPSTREDINKCFWKD